MSHLHVFVLMAGEGRRFADAGYAVPKPFIPIAGKPMFLWAAQNVEEISCPKKFCFVAAQGQRSAVAHELERSTRSCPWEIVEVTRKTNGPVDSLTFVVQQLTSDPVLILDCDVMIDAHAYYEFISRVVNGQAAPESGVVSFPSQDPRYSYAECDETRVLRTAEKKVISSHALTGAYFVHSGQRLLQAMSELLRQEREGEFYISEIYNALISRGEIVRHFVAQEVFSFGTPEEMEASLARLRERSNDE